LLRRVALVYLYYGEGAISRPRIEWLFWRIRPSLKPRQIGSMEFFYQIDKLISNGPFGTKVFFKILCS
jgi:hypothetical protein